MAQALWVLNLVWQAVAAGFAFSYAVTLGAFFQWQVRAGDDEFFTRVYPPFRTALGLKWRYRLFMPFGPALTAAASLALNHSAHAVLPQALAVVVFFLYYFLAHVPTGFAQAEEDLMSGKGLTERQRRIYLRCNIPLHILMGSLYAATAVALALT